MNARLLTPAYRAALNGGTAGRPNVVATTQDENGRIVVVYADGCMAVRVYRAGVHVWEGMEGPPYDELFTVPADVPVADAPALPEGPTTNRVLPADAHWCECPFPRSTTPNGMVCSACGGWR